MEINNTPKVNLTRRIIIGVVILLIGFFILLRKFTDDFAFRWMIMFVVGLLAVGAVQNYVLPLPSDSFFAPLYASGIILVSAIFLKIPL